MITVGRVTVYLLLVLFDIIVTREQEDTGQARPVRPLVV